MTTKFLASGNTLTVSNLFQNLFYIEGNDTVVLNPMGFNNGTNYSEIINYTFFLSGEVSPCIEIISSVPDAQIKQYDNFFTISSLRQSGQYTINDQIKLNEIVKGLSLRIIEDISQTFEIDVLIDDGILTKHGSISIIGSGVIDAINITQTNTIHEDKFQWHFQSDGQGLPSVQDQNGPNTGKTYRVTYSPSSGGDEKYRIFTNQAGVSGTDTLYSSTVSFEGDQTTINDRMNNSLHIDLGPDWNNPFSIFYTQEVIGGTPCFPYIQETGLLSFSPITADIADAVAPTQTYDEDVTSPVITIVTINDSRGTQDTSITYDASITLSDPISGTINIGVYDNIDTYNLTSLNKADMQAQFDLFQFTPSADYESNFSMLIFLDREQEHESPTWSGRQLLINETVLFNIGNTHNEFSLNTPQTYDEDVTLTFTPGQITDLAVGKTYTVTLTLPAIAGVLNQSVFNGTKSSVNSQMTNITFTPSADYIDNFTINYQQQQDTNAINQGNANININIGATHNEYAFIAGQPYAWIENANNVLDVVSITDLAVNKQYDVVLNIATGNIGEFRSFGTGGSSTPSFVQGSGGTLTLTGTKIQVNSHLSTLEFWPYKDYGTLFSWGYNQTQTTDNINQAVNIPVNMDTGTLVASPINTSLGRLFDEDETTDFNDPTKTF